MLVVTTTSNPKILGVVRLLGLPKRYRPRLSFCNAMLHQSDGETTTKVGSISFAVSICSIAQPMTSILVQPFAALGGSELLKVAAKKPRAINLD